jgi:Superoxide dismutase
MFELPKLPFERDALEPFISRETIDYHYGQHHFNYVKKLNELIKDTHFDKNYTLEKIVKESTGPIFNNAAQAWNHTFYWNCLTPETSGKPRENLGKAIIKAFGNYDNFAQRFTQLSNSLFGSGWTWLVADNQDRLSIIQCQNADNPLVLNNLNPLLTCDVWEHSYYIDRRNRRAEYIEAFWNIINWDFAEANYMRKTYKSRAHKTEETIK